MKYSITEDKNCSSLDESPIPLNRKNGPKNKSSHIRLRVSVSSHQGGRKYMEDEYSIVHYQSPTINHPSSNNSSVLQKSFAFFGIFDGHGGDMAARYTRQNLCRNIVRQRNFWSNDDDKICLAIHKGFVRTQKEMMKEVGNWPLTSLGLPSTSGTTASVVFIMNGKYYTGHVGDSRIVLGRKFDGCVSWQACPMTRDHKPESPRERKRIEATGGQVMNKSGIGRVVWNRPRKNISNQISEVSYDSVPFLSVARSLGDLWSLNKRLNKFVVSPEPDIKCIPIDPDDHCLILASDGLWNMITSKQAIKVIQDFEEFDEDDFSSCDSSDDYRIIPEIITEPDRSHSLQLLNDCLDRWCVTKMRADNTTVLVAMLDQFGHELKKAHNLDNNFDPETSDCMIGDTIHSYNFESNLFDENFLDNKTDDEEIASILNELLDRCCIKSQSYNNELIDDELLSLINFSTLSSHNHEQTANDTNDRQQSLYLRSNFNCSFSIFHNYSLSQNHQEASNNHRIDNEDQRNLISDIFPKYEQSLVDKDDRHWSISGNYDLENEPSRLQFFFSHKKDNYIHNDNQYSMQLNNRNDLCARSKTIRNQETESNLPDHYDDRSKKRKLTASISDFPNTLFKRQCLNGDNYDDNRKVLNNCKDSIDDNDENDGIKNVLPQTCH